MNHLELQKTGDLSENVHHQQQQQNNSIVKKPTFNGTDAVTPVTKRELLIIFCSLSMVTASRAPHHMKQPAPQPPHRLPQPSPATSNKDVVPTSTPRRRQNGSSHHQRMNEEQVRARLRELVSNDNPYTKYRLVKTIGSGLVFSFGSIWEVSTHPKTSARSTL
ncbi:hypothetical protein Ciccas_004873 [Cichlidogyrus casuarinus]|uniref:Uncharacterized protein n=1 Tax=Cichlidogyrus casuarinus TaxID=1844966 RepID=A0ABD2QA93_9PLAT